MPNILDVCQLVRLSWLKRLTNNQSTWKKLHGEEVGGQIINLTITNMENLKITIRKINNPVWRKAYLTLLKCVKNILTTLMKNTRHSQLMANLISQGTTMNPAVKG